MAKTNCAIIQTSLGDVKVSFFADKASKACENFTRLAKSGYYDGVIFHRVIKDFMIQGGDPTGTGRGGSSIWGKPFEDEFSDELLFDKKGLLAMANAGANTNGSQFFITTAKTPWLNNHHTIFGEVTDGYDVVEKIQGVKTNAQDKPLEKVFIKAIILEDAC